MLETSKVHQAKAKPETASVNALKIDGMTEMLHTLTKEHEAGREMGNQHGTERLAWLAGILDGEGSFMVVCGRAKARDYKPRYSPRISIANTDPRIMDACKAIFDGLGVRYCFYVQDKREVGGRQRMTLLLHVTNIDGITKVLDAVSLFLIGKREQADILRGAVGSWKSLSGSDRDAVYNRLRAMNQRIPRVDLADASEAKRGAPGYCLDEDMVRSNGKPLEAGGTRNDLPAPNLFGWGR